jgi:predicted nucleic acid-binding protein
MRLVDTSAWIEWTSQTPVGRRLGREIPSKERWLVPTVVQYELVRWARRFSTEDVADKFLAFSSRCVVAPLETPLAVLAAELSSKHALAMADAVIYATAQEWGADLLTCDAHFETLPSVVYFRKASAIFSQAPSADDEA